MNSSDTPKNDFDRYLESVTAAIRSGKLGDAESGIENLCRIAPNEESLRFSLADVRIALGNFEGARKALDEVPQKFKDSQSYLLKYLDYQKQIEEEAAKKLVSTATTFNNQFRPFKAEAVVYPGLKIVIVDTIGQVMNYYGLEKPGVILEKGIDKVVFEEDKYDRAVRDAEVLTSSCPTAIKS